MLSGVTSYPWLIDRVTLEGETIGLLSGVNLLSVDGVDITSQDTLSAVLSRLPTDPDVGYQIERDGSPRSEIAPRPDLPLIGTVASGSPADQAGILIGDLLISIDDAPVNSWSDLQASVSGSNGADLDVIYQRGNTTKAARISPMQNDGRWLLGVGALPLFTLVTETPPIGDAVVTGLDRTWGLITNLVTGLAGSLMGQNDSCGLDGPIAIATVAGQAIQLGPETFLLFLAVISLGLGILNLLPVPILDGGHLLLLGFEGLTGRPLGKRMQAVLFIVGVTMIAFLMLTATINDLTC
jgi:regulator of sigma E protease